MRCPFEDREDPDVLLAHTSHKLDAERAAVLEEHLASCPACREYAAAQLAVWEALDAWDAPPASTDFDRRLYRRIEQEVSWWDLAVRPFRSLFAGRGSLRALPVAAAAALLIAAGLWIEHPGSTPSVRVPQSAAVEALPPDQAARALQDMQAIQEFSHLVRPDSADSRM